MIAIPPYAVLLTGALLFVLLGAVFVLLRRNRIAAASFETLFGASAQALLLLDRAGRVVRANEPALGLFHAASAGLAGQALQELLDDPEIAEDDPWDLAKGPDQPLACVFRRIANQGRFRALVDFRVLRCGSSGLLLVAISDQTDVRRLQSCQARLYAVHEHGFQGVAVLQEGIFVYANAIFERLCGAPVAQLGEQTAQDVFHPQDREFAWGELTQSARCEEANRSFPCRLQRPDGADVWVRVTAICMEWERRPALFCFFTDVSAQQQLETLQSDLQYLNEADTKAPLTAVLGLPRRILQEGGLSPGQERQLQSVEQAGYTLLRSLHHSLDAYRMRTKAYGFAPDPVDLLALLERVREDLPPHERERFSAYALATDGQVLVAGDALLLYTLFYDCVRAVLSGSLPGGPLGCELLRKSDGVVVEFDFSHRQDADLQTPLAARIAALHQGALHVLETGPDTRVLSIRLPNFRQEQELDQDFDSAALQPVVAPWPRVRLLFAASDALQRRDCKARLAHLPYVVDLAANGEQAVEAVAQYNTRAYDLVCMDMRMPDGLAAVQQIRAIEQQEGRPRVPIVALLGAQGDPSDRSYFEVGCQAVLPQPLDPALLRSLIDRFAPPSPRNPQPAGD